MGYERKTGILVLPKHIIKHIAMIQPLYNTIGHNYNTNRRADPAILKNIVRLLNLPTGSLIADIGAGTGNYANALAGLGYRVIAIEPSDVMRRQATPHPQVKWLPGTAESLPIKDDSVNGVISILAIHHFSSIAKAAGELHRICPRGPAVILTYDPHQCKNFWFNKYFPSIYQNELELFPPADKAAAGIAGTDWKYEIINFPLPSDLADKNMHSGWNHPEIYFNEQMRQNTSGFARAEKSAVTKGLSQLKKDLDSGKWDAEYGHLRKQKEYHTGFVFVKLYA